MQKITLDINPKGEIPVLYVAQYDNGRDFQVELVDGEDAYNVPEGFSVQLNVRKTDSKIVTKEPESIVDNIITFYTTEQITACAGENIASVSINDLEDHVITTLYFLIMVQRDVLAGGLDSTSEIDNLGRQVAAAIEEVAPEIIEDIATPIVRSETTRRIEEYGGMWVLSDMVTEGSYNLYFRHRFIGEDGYTAYKVFSTDPTAIVDTFEIPSTGVLKVTMLSPVSIINKYMLQIFKPFGR